MTKEIKQIWKNFKDLDIQIRTIEKILEEDKTEGFYWVVEVGLFESLGEGGDILIEIFYSEPTEEQIIERAKQDLKETQEDLNEGINSYSEDERLKILNKIFGEIN